MNYSTYSLSELKALAIEHNAIPTGDKRSKQTWVDALELVALQSITEPESTESEAECTAVTADITTAADSEHVSVTDYGDMPETSSPKGMVGQANRKGAATLVIALLCTLFLAIQSTYEISIALKKISTQIYGKITIFAAGCFRHKSRSVIKYASA
jgi:hypothetical protein